MVQMDDIATPAKFIADRLKSLLNEHRQVVWLVSGGSCVSVAVEARCVLGELGSGVSLHVVLIDERYGDIGHSNSNSEQLIQAGFDVQGLTFHQMLLGEDIETTTKRYDVLLSTLFEESDYTIGLFGMGADAHTSGLLPGNPLMEDKHFVGRYDGPDFQRITTTPACIRSIDEAVLYAVGGNKWPALAGLELDGDANIEPVRVLKGISPLNIFTDYQKDM
jgi:6-phosphogluconolactonase/glucosamine-6-phosphate isomerase/deaminase